MIGYWQDNIKQTEGYILRSFKHDLSFKESLNSAALNKILKLLQRKAKLHIIDEPKVTRVAWALELIYLIEVYK